MDGVDHERPWRIPEQQAPGYGTRDRPAVDRQRAVVDLIVQARVAIRRAEHHIEVSAQRLNRCQVLLMSCAEQIRSTTEAVEGVRPVIDGARLEPPGC